ncbi:hypothetical protein Pla144_46210 [Bythopirellula polymerisocia]|uniref:3-keto-alpha-glucoside-1,2-lyase/3-keto-2-hydroxy-glucal hydratase domain-containing protein n=1 Tax=Bythopirellula polymerisocia TaxID=2528003 RepID=A0A5C6C9Y6_9BACT|nr:hypothetical protein Pla144_46210 [Bythopirellula polymerisocia]
MSFRILLFALLVLAGPSFSAAKDVKPHKDAVALFNGIDLDGWHGMGHTDPQVIQKMSDAEKEQKIKKDSLDFNEHWIVEQGELVNDGHGVYATTDQDYGDIELWIDYKTVPLADSGVYLRGSPQVQIWDTTKTAGKWELGADKGSGGLWNNSPGSPMQRPHCLGGSPLGRVESTSYHPSGGADLSLAQRPVGGRSCHNGKLLGSQTTSLKQWADPIANAWRRNPLAEYMGP